MPSSIGNHMLNAFSPALRASIMKAGEHVSLVQSQHIASVEELQPYVYFINSGLCSMVISMQDGRTAEVAMCGRDGMAGSLSLLGPQCCSAATVIQIGGGALRVPRREAERWFAQSTEFRCYVLAWAQMAWNVSLQTSACGLLHDAESRLARWLLMCADRAESNNLYLTQEFLAEMLGTQRTTVATVASCLKRKGLIEYVRGNVTILDRSGLMDTACECYEVARKGMAHLYHA
ncbi:Crp/Fnr family transcriptional regulator [Terriglobus sp. TAA 43]|uniref:Crp/Fnr family transcriptional regulator n=1 Tax=Terriglobus sp. TAA 43 TaxID=278961 RepID=UPI000646F981|nr:Crp/Fnr family transcriptional regulator [Terriglobus sp. TAA 43]